jgi:hypothetical protein
MKMKQRLLVGLLTGLVLSIVGSLTGMLASKLILKMGYDIVWWDTHVQGNPPLLDKPEGHFGKQETFFGKIVSEQRGWIWSTRPNESHGVQDFKTMLFDICMFTGWFTGTLLGAIYLLAQIVIGVSQHRRIIETC